ncbi:hypothetical protein V811_01230 [Staphylococcus aureus M90388]|uniref:hypothetical protein n=1 Tax=Staphylococcus aureus TaxID=1280 RepID=UPI00044ACC9C|nr:hypothetical protein [Staphylococcus aureus]EVY79018.1 hypothetical protein U332_02465 [Staphylococcus aureus H79477]EWU84482.1 hypothetical protein U353_01914 [Staphylococcus aureus H41336]EXP82964.1 hypothetical protein V811_01230 [Staphylococcus aureus M90388]EXQ08695.1 hypothetical protein V799_01116 [Staphylococcus aureus M42184]EXQ66947.1 hypothetical protein V762_01109 [Staphylococcus aureus F26051]
MWNFIKCVFKFVFSLVAITTLVAGFGVVAFAYIFKKDFEDIERKTKEIISDIESKNN